MLGLAINGTDKQQIDNKSTHTIPFLTIRPSIPRYTKNILLCKPVATYQTIKTGHSTMPKSTFFGILKVLIISTRFPAKIFHPSPAKKGTRKRAKHTSVLATKTPRCRACLSPSTRCRTSTRVCHRMPTVPGIQ